MLFAEEILASDQYTPILNWRPGGRYLVVEKVRSVPLNLTKAFSL